MRKTIDVTVTQESAPSADGRDNGKVFRITEMAAFPAEEWANRATLALLPRLTKEVPEEVAAELAENPSMPSLARIGLLIGGISFPETKELLREIMDCVQIIPDPKRPMPRAIGLGGSEDIEEVATIQFLRKEALALHTGFTLAAALFNLISAVSTMSPFTTTATSPKP